MYYPSFTLILSGIFIAYILYALSSLVQLFIPPKCDLKSSSYCFPSYLTLHPDINLYFYTSTNFKPFSSDINLLFIINKFKYNESFTRELEFKIPQKTLKNGTLFLHVIAISSKKKIKPENWNAIQSEDEITSLKIPVTQYAIPQAKMFNLLNEQKSETSKTITVKPVTHLKSKITFIMFTDLLSLPSNNLPIELIKAIKLSRKGEYLPIIQHDFLQTRLRDLIELSPNNTSTNITISYNPIGIGKLRLLMQLETALSSLTQLGFSEKDVDEVKGIFADTNIYLLCITVFVSSIHLLFDFLAFKSDLAFWKNKRSLAGLSARVVIWRAFSQTVIFLYLLDENTSLLILIPCGIASIIECWKITKVFKINITIRNYLPHLKIESLAVTEEEKRTQEYDAECMRYLSYLLYPLCFGAAVYSLLYEPHRSWYSWTIHSVVNGVYVFGFLFMLPQLFVNYRLKSVAALPWKTFTYKAFNTFIDDLFAFIITMPTAHRMACFRDDIVFIIYLYQRWLYPVDSSRIDVDARLVENEKIEAIKKENKDTKTKKE